MFPGPVIGRHDTVLEEIGESTGSSKAVSQPKVKQSPSPRYSGGSRMRTPSPSNVNQFPINGQNLNRDYNPQSRQSGKPRMQQNHRQSGDIFLDDSVARSVYEELKQTIQQQHEEYYKEKMLEMYAHQQSHHLTQATYQTGNISIVPPVYPQIHQSISPEPTAETSQSQHSDMSDLTAAETLFSPQAARHSRPDTKLSAPCTVLALDQLTGRMHLSAERMTEVELRNAIQLLNEELLKQQLRDSQEEGNSPTYSHPQSQPSSPALCGSARRSSTPSPTNLGTSSSKRHEVVNPHRWSFATSQSVPQLVPTSKTGPGQHNYLQQTISSAAKVEVTPKSEKWDKEKVRAHSRTRSRSSNGSRNRAVGSSLTIGTSQEPDAMQSLSPSSLPPGYSSFSGRPVSAQKSRPNSGRSSRPGSRQGSGLRRGAALDSESYFSSGSNGDYDGYLRADGYDRSDVDSRDRRGMRRSKRDVWDRRCKTPPECSFRSAHQHVVRSGDRIHRQALGRQTVVMEGPRVVESGKVRRPQDSHKSTFRPTVTSVDNDSLSALLRGDLNVMSSPSAFDVISTTDWSKSTDSAVHIQPWRVSSQSAFDDLSQSLTEDSHSC